MYMQPDASCYLLSNVPLDSSYQHTLYFSSKEAQEAYFKSMTNINNAPEEQKPYTFENQTYIRVLEGQQGVFKAEMLPHNSDDMMTLNYMMFQNDLFQHKWFYAFITDIIYVGNRVYEIHFELDYMQSFMFNYKLKECWVEREHVNDDTIGKHTLPEPVDIGELTCMSVERSFTMNSYEAILVSSAHLDEEPPLGGVIGGLYTGLRYQHADLNDPAQINSLNQALQIIGDNNWADMIAAFFIMPKGFFTMGEDPITKTVSQKRPKDLDGYEPRNKKLLTYPYLHLYVHNSCGNGIELRYERFNDPERIDFNIESCMACNPEIMCVPRNYNGENINYNNKLIINCFPQVAWSYDTFKAWLAMNAGTTGISLAGTVLGGIGAAATGNIAGAIGAGVGASAQIANLVAKSNAGSTIVGNQSGNVLVANKQLDFYFQQKSITKEYARIIDDFFDRFGYACMRNKVPATHSRPHWNYIKTSGCTIVGTLPKRVAEKICSIYDAGITFWKNPSEVGDYSLDNTI